MGAKIATGLYRTPTGFRVFVRVRTGPKQSRLISKCFQKLTPLTVMKQWREDRRVEARRTAGPTPAKGTLAADIERYLLMNLAMPSYKDRKRDLYAWREKFGDLDRAALTKELIQATLHEWRTIGPVLHFVPKRNEYRRFKRPLSVSACNHRRTALLCLFNELDGPDAPNPVRAVPPFEPPTVEPRGRPLAFLLAAVDRMRNADQRAIARVLLWTGIRGNSELARMTAAHVDLEHGVCRVPTGKGGKSLRAVPLNAAGVAAWQDYAARNLWGPYDRKLILKAFKRACKAEAKARGSGIVSWRLYDQRHSIATAYLEAGADLADIQSMLGHTTGRMTRRYAPYTPGKLAAIGKTLEQVTSTGFDVTSEGKTGRNLTQSDAGGDPAGHGHSVKMA